MLNSGIDDLLLRREPVELDVLRVVRDDGLTVGTREHEVAEAEGEVRLSSVEGVAFFAESLCPSDVVQEQVGLKDHTVDIFPVGSRFDDAAGVALAELVVVLRLVG